MLQSSNPFRLEKVGIRTIKIQFSVKKIQLDWIA
jgi:hypothetical protein